MKAGVMNELADQVAIVTGASHGLGFTGATLDVNGRLDMR
jgi:NADP-dependent 3-hydroxy acid dehydrogenase YdfG